MRASREGPPGGPSWGPSTRAGSPTWWWRWRGSSGGVKLGTGGLKRAYGQVAREALQGCRTELAEAALVRLTVQTSYPHLGALLAVLDAQDLTYELQRSDTVSVTVTVAQEAAPTLQERLNEIGLKGEPA